MPYIYSRPASPTFNGRGLLGYAFGPLAQKDVDLYYVEVEGGHDTFMISNKITRIYYILSGEGCFTIDGRRHDVGSGTVVEIPPMVEYTYSGRMRFVAFGTPRWRFGNDRHTRWNEDVVGAGFSAPLPNNLERRRLSWLRMYLKSRATTIPVATQRAWKLRPAALTMRSSLRQYSGFLRRLIRMQKGKG